MKVLVVGAGLAGLSAAAELVRQGERVTVVDPDGPGGKVRTVSPREGWRVEAGPHSFTHRADAIFELVDRLGLTSRVVRVGARARARYLARRGRLRRAPLGGALSAGELLAAVRGLFRRTPPTGTVRDWLVATFGEPFADGPGAALTAGIWAARPHEIELASGFPALTAGLREHGSLVAWARAREATRTPGTYGFDGGLSTLADALSDAVGGVERTRVDGLRRTAAGWIARGGPTSAAVGPEAYDGVVLAVEASAAAQLLGAWPQVAEGLTAIRYSPLLVAHWLARDAAFPRGFGYLAPPTEPGPVLGTVFASDLHPDTVPEGHRGFTTMIGGTREPGAVGLDAQAARGIVEEEHRRLTGRPVTIEAVHVVRHSRAVALPELGHAGRVDRIHRAAPPGLVLAGAWCGSGAMEDAVRAGRQAAERLRAGDRGVGRVA